MKFLTPAVVVIGALALSGCTNNSFNPFKRGDAGDDPSATMLDGPIDETSIAFFNTSVGDRVLFVVDQSGLTPEAIAILDAQATWLLANGDKTALIEGHADEQGTREYNLALGARRAAAVREYLVSQGVPDSRLRTISYGKERPLQICSDEACYSQNRRAVTVISAGLGA